MTDAPPRSGVRVIAFLGALLVVAVGLVAWFATREETPAAAKKTPTVVEPAREAPTPAPKPPRPKTEEEAPPLSGTEPPPTWAPHVDESGESETTKLDVEVLGIDGLAAPGATVLLLNPLAQHVSVTARGEIARAKADDAGHATFDVAAKVVRVYAWRDAMAGASEKIRPSKASDHVVVRMSAAVPVKGRVVETGGAPVAGAYVRFVAQPWFDDPFGVMVETTSDKEGAFELPPVPASAFESMQENAATIEARAQGWPASSVSVTADALRAGEVVVTLERGAFLRGRLVRPTGEPVVLEEVRLADGRSIVRSGADGSFELPLPRFGGAVIARAKSEPSAISVNGRPAGNGTVPFGWGAAKLLGRFRGDAGDVDLGDVTLSAGQPIKGVVVDQDDKPLAAADVKLSLAGVELVVVQTDDAGKFEIESVGDDDHVLTAVEPPGPNAWFGQRHASLDGVKGGQSDLKIRITGALSVLVKFLQMADNAPVVVPEATIRVAAVGATPRPFGWTWTGAGISVIRFEVRHAGRYTATVELPGYEPATTEAFDVSAERGVEISVLFRRRP